MSSVVFILLFLYVFGSAIHVPGISYKNYMFPGIIGQVMGQFFERVLGMIIMIFPLALRRLHRTLAG